MIELNLSSLHNTQMHIDAIQKRFWPQSKHVDEEKSFQATLDALTEPQCGKMQGKIETGQKSADTPLASDLKQMVLEAAKKYGVDSRLVSAIVKVESSGKQTAISPTGAIGVMQLMPETAAELDVDPYDVVQNIDGGTRYLRKMLDTFGGDVKKAVAAYNAGATAVQKYSGVPPYRETQNYVNKVLGAM